MSGARYEPPTAEDLAMGLGPELAEFAGRLSLPLGLVGDNFNSSSRLLLMGY
jgi:hypothetical protein